jgi:hypothetical protein
MTISDIARPANGRAHRHDVLRLGQTIEDRRPVEVNARPLMAWVTVNGRYPSSVAAELDDHRNRWLSTRTPVDPSASTPATLWQAALELTQLLEQGIDDPTELRAAALRVATSVHGLQADPEMRSPEVDWQEYLTNALCTLIPGLEPHEADMLPADVRLGALAALGYLRAPGLDLDAEPEGEADNDAGGVPQRPPEAGPSSIGDEPAPDSAASTD